MKSAVEDAEGRKTEADPEEHESVVLRGADNTCDSPTGSHDPGRDQHRADASPSSDR
jgi:hypothetical protein